MSPLAISFQPQLSLNIFKEEVRTVLTSPKKFLMESQGSLQLSVFDLTTDDLYGNQLQVKLIKSFYIERQK